MYRTQICGPFQHFLKLIRRFPFTRVISNSIFINYLACSIFLVLFKAFRTRIPACRAAYATIAVDNYFYFALHHFPMLKFPVYAGNPRADLFFMIWASIPFAASTMSVSTATFPPVIPSRSTVRSFTRRGAPATGGRGATWV